MKTSFQAFDGYWDNGNVWICEDGKPVARLNPRLDVMNKSPTGFAWGYEGSGPAQLAFAILAHIVGPHMAQKPCYFQIYKREVIGKLDQKAGFTITEQSVLDWIAKQSEAAS